MVNKILPYAKSAEASNLRESEWDLNFFSFFMKLYPGWSMLELIYKLRHLCADINFFSRVAEFRDAPFVPYCFNVFFAVKTSKESAVLSHDVSK